MKKNLFIILTLILSLQLVGCAHQGRQEAAPVVDKSEQSSPNAPVVEPEKPAVTTPGPTTPTSPQPRAPAQVSNAVSSLITEARAQYQAKNYQGAIATAERALRIDRRSPEIYLILAQSYVQLANTQLASQFVQQGIRYAQAGSDVAQRLVKVRESLAH